MPRIRTTTVAVAGAIAIALSTFAAAPASAAPKAPPAASPPAAASKASTTPTQADRNKSAAVILSLYSGALKNDPAKFDQLQRVVLGVRSGTQYPSAAPLAPSSYAAIAAEVNAFAQEANKVNGVRADVDAIFAAASQVTDSAAVNIDKPLRDWSNAFVKNPPKGQGVTGHAALKGRAVDSLNRILAAGWIG